jgi:hypothetical protein
MRQSFPDLERRLARNSADLRARMAEVKKLRLAIEQQKPHLVAMVARSVVA